MRISKKKIAAVIVSVLLTVATIVGIVMSAGATTYTVNDVTSSDGGYAYKKTITSNTDGTYDVELTINNYKSVIEKEVTTYSPMDVVIILDASASMATYLDTEESSALSIIESLYKISSTYTPSDPVNIAVVEFGASTIASENVNNTTSTKLDWTTVTSSNYKSGGTIYNAVTGLTHRAVSSSRLDLAIDRAGSLLSSKNSDGRDKFVIVFSDGSPTISGELVPTTARRSSTISKAASVKNQTYGSSSGNKAKIYSVIIGATSFSSASAMSAGEATMALVSSGTCKANADGSLYQYNYTEYTTEFSYYINSSTKNPTWFCSYSKSSGLTQTQVESITNSLMITDTKTTTTGGTNFNTNTVVLDKVNDAYFTITGTPKVYTESVGTDGEYTGTLTDITSSTAGFSSTDSYVRLTGYDFEGTSVTDSTSVTKITTYSGSRVIIKYQVKQNSSYIGDGGSFDVHLTSSNKNTTAYKPNDGYVSGIYSSSSSSTPLYTLGTVAGDVTAVTAGELTIVFHGNGNTEGSMENQVVSLSGASSTTLNKNKFIQGRTICFHGNGGIDSEVLAPATFLGWATSAASAEKNSYSFTDAAKVDLSSYYTSGSTDYTLDLYACWGSPSVECPDKTRDHYTLVGYSTAADSDAESVLYEAGDYVVLQNLYNDLYAIWEQKEYVITYNYSANAGTSVSDATKVITKGSTIDLTPTAEKAVSQYNSSWQFVGWSLNPDSETLIDSAYVPSGDMTVYAVFKLNMPVIVYALNKSAAADYGICTNAIYNNESSLSYYNAVVNRQMSGITSSDYTGTLVFSEDDIIRSDNESSYTVSADADYSTEHSLTVYKAGDTPDKLNTSSISLNYPGMVAFHSVYDTHATVSFNTDGGSSVSSLSTAVKLVATGGGYEVSEPGSVTLPAALTKTGYLFKGWQVNGYTTLMDPGDTLPVIKNTVVTAVYDLNNFTVTYDYKTNGGVSVDIATKSLAPGSTIDTSPVATKIGWNFLGWSLDKDSTTLITSADLMPKNDIMVYAVFSKTLTADFFTLDGCETKTGTIYNNETETVIAAPSFNNKEIDGYSKGLAATGKYTDDIYASEPVLYNSVTISEDSEFYAAYKTNAVIKYDSDGGDTTPENTMGTEITVFSDYKSDPVTSDRSAGVLAEGVTKTGYTFSGWKRGTTVYNPGDTLYTDKDTTVTAQWTPIKYTVKYDSNGASNGSIASTEATYDQTYKAANNAFYFDTDGSYFVCWNTQADGSGTDYYEGSAFKNLSPVDGDTVTLYARWLSASKSVEAIDGAYTPGKRVKYTISYTFPTENNDVIITDSLPSAVKYSDTTNAAGWEIAHVNKNETVTKTVTATINSIAAGTVVNNTATMTMNSETEEYETNNVSFVVKYSKVSYEGSGLDNEQGAVPVDNSFYVNGDTVTVRNCELIVPGYTFVGFENKKDKTFFAEGDTFTINEDDVTLTAMFSKITKKSECSYIAPGEDVKYTIKVYFPGDITSSAEFTDNVPSELEIISVSDTTNLIINGNKVSGSITAGSDRTYTAVINCKIASGVSTGTDIQNKASVKYAALNKTVESNTDTLSMGYKLTYVDEGENFWDGKYYQPADDIIVGGEKKAAANDYFIKWCTAEDGTGVMYEEGDTINLEADVTLYAMKVHLEKKVTSPQTDYLPNESVSYDIYLTVPYTIGLTELEDLLPDGLTVNKFYLVTDSGTGDGSESETGESEATKPSEGEPSEEEETEEKATEKIFVVDPNGGYWEYEGKAYVSPVTLHLETFAGPSNDAVRLGYTFKGWNKSESGDTTTYTAQWEENTSGIPYALYIDPNGGTWTHDGKSYTEITEVNITDYSEIEDPVKDGFTFGGWVATDKYETDSEGKATSLDTTFTATWIEAGKEEDSSSPVEIGDDSTGGSSGTETAKEYKISFSAEQGKTYHFILEATVNKDASPSTDKHEGGRVNLITNKVQLLFDGNTVESEGASIKIADYHTITYCTVELDGMIPSGEAPVDEAYYRHGDSATVLSADTISMDGYTFIAWSTAEKRDKGVEYDVGDSVTLDSDVKLYAIFSESKDLPETGAIGIVVIAAISAVIIGAYIYVIIKRKKED